MSCRIIDRKHLLTIAAFVDAHTGKDAGERAGLFYYKPDRPYDENYYPGQRVAFILMEANEKAFSQRYREAQRRVRRISDAELKAVPVVSPAEINGILRALSYQCGDADDWDTSEARELYWRVMELALNVHAESMAALAPELANERTYTWA